MRHLPPSPVNPTVQRDPELARNRRLRMLRVAANFGPFVAIFLTSIFSYLMLEHWGVRKLDVIGKVPQGFRGFNPLSMSSDDFKVSIMEMSHHECRS